MMERAVKGILRSLKGNVPVQLTARLKRSRSLSHHSWRAAVCLLLALLASPLLAQTTTHPVITGRVVDEQGQPVAQAQLLIVPPPQRRRKAIGHEMLFGTDTDEHGRFKFEDEYKWTTSRRIMYISAPLRADVYAPVTPPLEMIERIDPSFRGQPIVIKRNQATDLGDVKVQIHYGLVQLRLQNSAGGPLLQNAEQWRNIRLRFRTARGEVVDGGLPSLNDIEKAVRIAESAITVAVPKGAWQIEVTYDDDQRVGRGLTPLLHITDSDVPVPITVMLSLVRRR